ncbi:MAG TPA: hypothetical protein VGI19_00085 [Candidatus Cybelea sp.]|jgi:hypothetical protein
MSDLRYWLRGASAVAVFIALAACAQQDRTFAPTTLSAASIAPDALPPSCKGQKTTKQYASVSEQLLSKGGSLCVPAFGGFGGSIKYPPANPSVKLGLTSSTTNYDHLPNLGKGSPIFYLQLAISGGTTFGQNVRAGGGLTSQQIDPGEPYTIYGQAVVHHIPFNFGPCYAVATKGKYGGVLGGVGTLLKGARVPVAATAVLEIYAGQQTNKECSSEN